MKPNPIPDPAERAAYLAARERLLEKAKPQGPCFLCGPRNYARHRLWDAIDCGLRVDRMSVAVAADNWSVPVEEVIDVRAAFNGARKRRRALPGRAVEEIK